MATPSPRRRRALLPVLLGLCLHAAPAASKAILGIDLGATFMKVALVKRNSPLEIVTNMHSKRRTEQMVLFDQGTRFYGADANSMAARKPSKIPSLMSVMLGRDDAHPTVKVSLLWFGRSVGQSVGRLDGPSVGRSVGLSVGRLVGRSVGRLVGRLVSRYHLQ